MPRTDEVHRHHRPSRRHRRKRLPSRRGYPQIGQACRRSLELVCGQVTCRCPRAHQQPCHEQRHRGGAQRRTRRERRRGGALGDPQPEQTLDVGLREAAGHVLEIVRDALWAVPVEHVTPQAHQERRHLLTRQIIIRPKTAIGFAPREAQSPSTQNVSRPITIGGHITELRNPRNITQPRRSLRHNPSRCRLADLRRDHARFRNLSFRWAGRQHRSEQRQH